MLSFEFEEELLGAIEKAIAGTGINPAWVLRCIEPVIERHCQSAQPSAPHPPDNIEPRVSAVKQAGFPSGG